jgi:hypothetical protein
MTAGKAKQALIASRVGGHDQLPEQAADRRNSGRGQGVAVGVDADDAVHRSASMAMNALPPRSTLWCRPGGTPHGEPVMSHNHRGWTGCCIKPETVAPGRRQHPADDSSPRQPHWRLIRRGSCRDVPTPKPDSDPQDRPHTLTDPLLAAGCCRFVPPVPRLRIRRPDLPGPMPPHPCMRVAVDKWELVPDPRPPGHQVKTRCRALGW